VKIQKKAAAVLIILSMIGVSGHVFAQATTAEPESSISYNLGVVSDYRYRGISQTGRKPALQFGVDYADKSGFYLGNWNSTIEWIKDKANANATTPQSARGPLEMDFYGGYKGSISELIGYDVGALEYFYPTNNLNNVTNGVNNNFSNASTTELYGSLSIGAIVLKLSDSLTNLFGYVGTKNSLYVDLSYSIDFGDGLSSIVHYGNQSMKASNAYYVTSGVTDYNDYSLSLNKDFDGWVVSGTLIATDWAKRGAHINDTLPGSGSSNLAGTTLVLAVKKNF
jgi:uncharacterized protein (TIGR02001 family)